MPASLPRLGPGCSNSRQLRAAEPLPGAQHAVRRAEALALRYELIRRGSVELEHLVVAGDDELRPDRLRQPGRLAAVQVPGDSPLGRAAVDGEEGDVRWKVICHLPHKPGVKHGVAAMVD